MRTIENLTSEDKNNLILYKMYKYEYVTPYIRMIFLSLLTIFTGMITAFLPTFIADYAQEDISDMSLLLAFIHIQFLGTVIAFSGVCLFGLSVFMLDRKKRKLQVAFQLEHNGLFDEVFTIEDKDIKDVKRIWKLR